MITLYDDQKRPIRQLWDGDELIYRNDLNAGQEIVQWSGEKIRDSTFILNPGEATYGKTNYSGYQVGTTYIIVLTTRENWEAGTMHNVVNGQLQRHQGFKYIRTISNGRKQYAIKHTFQGTNFGLLNTTGAYTSGTYMSYHCLDMPKVLYPSALSDVIIT